MQFLRPDPASRALNCGPHPPDAHFSDLLTDAATLAYRRDHFNAHDDLPGTQRLSSRRSLPDHLQGVTCSGTISAGYPREIC